MIAQTLEVSRKMTTLLSEAATMASAGKTTKKIKIIIQAKAGPKESFGIMDSDHAAFEHVLVDNEGHVVDDSGKRSHSRRQSLPAASSYRGISYGKSERESASFKSVVGKKGEMSGSGQQRGGKDRKMQGVRRQLSIGLQVLSQRHTFHIPKALFYKLPLFAERIKSLGEGSGDDAKKGPHFSAQGATRDYGISFEGYPYGPTSMALKPGKEKRSFVLTVATARKLQAYSKVLHALEVFTQGEGEGP